MYKIPIAVQLYSLRNECEKDFKGTLEIVAQLGFDGVELAGYHGYTVQEVKEMLDGLGLKAASNHVPIDDLEHNLEQVINNQKILDCKYVVCPYLVPEQRTESLYQKLIKLLNEAGAECRKEGLTLCYHNHDFELVRLSDGRTALETIFEETNVNDVHAEFDIYWLTKAGESPADWINRYPNRTPIVHLKDMTTDEEQFFAELGTGGVDLDTVLNMGVESGVQWWIIEQDESRVNPLESMRVSIEYLKEKLR